MPYDPYNDQMFQFAATGHVQPQGESWLGMPAPVIAAGIGAGSQLIGGLIGGHAQSHAADLEAQNSAATLAYAKERDAQNRADAQAQWQAQQAQLAPYLQMRASILSRYGLKIPKDGYGANPSLAALTAPAAGAGYQGARPSMYPTKATAMQPTGPEVATQSGGVNPNLSLASLPDWSRQAWMGRA